MKRLAIFLIALTMSICSAPLVQTIDKGEILSAETRTVTIVDPAQVDSFTYNGEADQKAVIRMSRESGSLILRVSLYAPDWTLLAEAWGNPSVDIEPQLLQSGLYTISVRDQYKVYAQQGEKTMPSTTIEEVLKKHTKELMSLPEVVGIGQGLCNNRLCIKVYVIKKSPELDQKIPAILDGYEVEIEITGMIRAHPKNPG